jgi:CRISPR/Cas system CMR-associated protein Cmr1 (group 7 of RAMP superfamily)
VLREGASFELRVTVRDPAILECIQKVIAFWATFGGLGSRTRRGAGAICVHLIPEKTLVSVLDEVVGGSCKALVARRAVHARHASPKSRNGLEALAEVVGALKAFRQQPNGLARNGSYKRPGRSFWPEPDAVRLLVDQASGQGHSYFSQIGGGRNHTPVHPAKAVFPRAAFGMPLGIRFMKAVAATGVDEPGQEPMDRELIPEGQRKRMASPLLTRAVAVVDEHGALKYVPVAAVLLLHPAHKLKNAVLKPAAGGTTHVAVWEATWMPGVIGECDGVHVLEQPGCAGVAGAPFPKPSNAVQAFMNCWAAKPLPWR